MGSDSKLTLCEAGYQCPKTDRANVRRNTTLSGAFSLRTHASPAGILQVGCIRVGRLGGYSYLKATMGSARIARRAGM